MRKLELKPNGFTCTLRECPPGLFLRGDDVGLKTEYGNADGTSEAYCESGEVFWGNANKGGLPDDTIVQPLIAEWTNK